MRVIEVATDLFVEKGYAETSLIQIAKRAGVGSNLIYQHFGDKERLFREIVFARRTNRMEELPGFREGETPADALFRAARYMCEISFRERSRDLMRLFIAESQRFPELMREVANKSLNLVVDNVATLLDDMAAAGRIPPCDSRLGARIFVDLVLGMAPLRAYANWELADPSDDELRLRVGIFITGFLEARPDPTGRTPG